MSVVEELGSNGFAILKKVIHSDLVNSLKIEHDIAEKILRDKFGPTAHRLQSLEENAMNMDLFHSLAQAGPFRKFLEIFEEERFYGAYKEDPFRETSFLFSPEYRSRCTYWHRDWRDRCPVKFDQDAFNGALENFLHFLAITIPLKSDDSFWYVPGSHCRQDTREESTFRRSSNLRWSDWDMLLEEEYRSAGEGRSYDEFLQDYAASMPGSQKIMVDPGDMLVFSTVGWHFALYSPLNKRAAIQDVVGSVAFAEWSRKYSNNPPRHKGA